MWATEQDQRIIDQLAQDFYANSQAIIEQYYLQPLTKDDRDRDLPVREKSNLKDGRLERFRFGAMHVGRAQFWVHIINEIVKEQLPEQHKAIFQTLSSTLQLNEKQTIALIRYLALFYCSTQEAEVDHIFKGYKSYREFLLSHNLNATLINIFTSTIDWAPREGPEGYTKILKKKGFQADDIPHLQYIRKLIYLATYFEEMRGALSTTNTYTFSLDKVLKEFKDMKPPQDFEKTMLNVATQVSGIIRAQGDMLHPCCIQLPDGECIDVSDNRSRTVLSEKVAIEHAENVCSVIGDLIKTHSGFKPYLLSEVFLSTARADIAPAFNPYIHGTPSSIFSLLARTDGYVMPIWDLLQACFAPMDGEMTGFISSIYEGSSLCFGRMNGTGDSYNLSSIIEGYAQMHLTAPAIEVTRHCLEKYTQSAFNSGFEYFHGILIFTGRARQLGIEPFTPKAYENLMRDFNAVMRIYYLCLLMIKHISASENIPPQHQNEIFYRAFKASFIPKVIASNIDMQAIYEDTAPTQETLQPVLDLLALPEEVTFHQATFHADDDISEQTTVAIEEKYRQMFCYTAQRQPDGSHEHMPLFTDTDVVLKSSLMVDPLSVFACLQGKFTNASAENFTRDVLYRVKLLEQKMAVFKKIHDAAPETAMLNPREQCFLTNIFPIVLVCSTRAETEEKIDLITYFREEFRADEPLKLGEDIDMIATDTPEHQDIIITFLREHNITNVDVVLFEQLVQSQKDGKKPVGRGLSSTAPVTPAAALAMSDNLSTPKDQFGINLSPVATKSL